VVWGFRVIYSFAAIVAEIRFDSDFSPKRKKLDSIFKMSCGS
jgi:hypothetical protein